MDALTVVEPALWVHRGSAPPMREFHRHDDLEINVAVRGSLEYLLGGERIPVPEGHTAMFWAAAPHRLIGAATTVRSETVALRAVRTPAQRARKGGAGSLTTESATWKGPAAESEK